MKKKVVCITTGILFLSIIFFSCPQAAANGDGDDDYDGPEADWARTVSVSTLASSSRFFGIASDLKGSIYAVGSLTGTDPFIFGNLLPVSGTSENPNALLVKYNEKGSALWVQTPTSTSTPTGSSRFHGAVVKSNGNIYAVGYINNGTYTFANGVQLSATSEHTHCILIKYSSNGTALWAQSSEPDKESVFYSVTTDSSGNIYAAGYIGNGSYTFGKETKKTVSSTSSRNAVIVKYDPAGNAVDAFVISGGTSEFLSVTHDNTGNIYAAGYIGKGNYTLAGRTIATTQNENAFVVKFSSPDTDISEVFYHEETTAASRFNGVSVDSEGNVVAAGSMKQGEIIFSPTVKGVGLFVGENSLLVKYDASATPLWMQTTLGSNTSLFSSVYTDSSGNVYAAGKIDGIQNFNLGNGVVIAGSSDSNCLAVKYNSAGYARWAFSVFGTNTSIYNAIITDRSNKVYAAGIIGNGYFDFDDATATGQAKTNCVLVRYSQ